MPLIQYIGHRETYKDGIYGTGEWTRDITKDIPDSTARKMVKHRDVYIYADQETDDVKGGVTIDVVEIDKDKNKEDDPDQGARDAIAAMDSKDAIASYAQVNFGQKIPKTLTLDNMKQQAIMMIDQFGIS